LLQLLHSLCLPLRGAASEEPLPDTGRMLYFGKGQPQDLIPWSPLVRDDFLAEEPPGYLVGHRGLIGAVSCLGMQMHEQGASVVAVERLPTGEKRYVARLYRPLFTAVFDRICSWWNPRSDDPEYLLEHEQVHFDIAEVAARQLTLKIRADKSFETRSPSRSDALARLEVWVGIEVKRALDEAQERHERFDRETSDVRSRPRQQHWANVVRGELAGFAPPRKGKPGD
jgi:hypothetical protein